MAGETIGAVVVAAGRGSRMKSDTEKQFLQLGGRALGFWCLQALEPFVDEIVIVCPAGEEEKTRRELTADGVIRKVTAVVPGGKERSDSVQNGLAALSSSCAWVLIQDAARPCLRPETVEKTIREMKACGACVVGVPVVYTVKRTDTAGVVQETVDRSSLWEVQTPQAFSLPLIRRAYAAMNAAPDRRAVTDDASVVELYTDHPVRMVEGFHDNIKVTVPEDLPAAELYLKKQARI